MSLDGGSIIVGVKQQLATFYRFFITPSWKVIYWRVVYSVARIEGVQRLQGYEASGSDMEAHLFYNQLLNQLIYMF